MVKSQSGEFVYLPLGEGIGREVSEAACEVFEAASVPLQFKLLEVSSSLANDNLLSVLSEVKEGKASKTIWKGPHSSQGQVCTSAWAKEIYHQAAPVYTVTHFLSFQGVPGRYSGVDLKLVAPPTDNVASPRVYLTNAFEYAVKHKIKELILVHRVATFDSPDAIFLSEALRLSLQYPAVQLKDLVLEKACQTLIAQPEKIPLLVAASDCAVILSHVLMGITSGPGCSPVVHVGEEITIFEPAHGAAPDIAGMGIANPLAMIRAGVLMLEAFQLNSYSEKIMKAVRLALVAEECRTIDLKGLASTDKFVKSIIHNLK